MLQKIFIELLYHYSNNTVLANLFWKEIEKQYNKRNRHYHTLEHLENLLKHLEEVKEQIRNWDAILFSLFYHDVIYDPLKTNNEEKSADFAKKRMQQLYVPQQTIENCEAQIIATKKHSSNTDADINYFTDSDLSILGSEWEIYSTYFKQVRKEYSIYPDLIYNPGRKKVLQHFLEMERIFKTDYFSSKFESQARLNLQKELSLLQKTI